MNITIKIYSKTKVRLIRELNNILKEVINELNDPICKNCKSCKDIKEGCYVSGGFSNSMIDSEWKLRRNYKEHKNICKSKQRK